MQAMYVEENVMCFRPVVVGGSAQWWLAECAAAAAANMQVHASGGSGACKTEAVDARLSVVEGTEVELWPVKTTSECGSSKLAKNK